MLFRAALMFGLALFWCGPAGAWGAKGHQLIGRIADDLLTENAAVRAEEALGFSLETSGPWLDCVKSVEKEDDGSFRYEDDFGRADGPCAPFETEDERARMEDYARRNWSNCDYRGGERGCHETYHFADVAVRRGRYDRAFAGTSDHDIVSAVKAAIDFLQGRPVPPPFSIRDRKEALLMLAHLIGDLHQPLHVGAVYLDDHGTETDPDEGDFDPETDTRGGNLLLDGDRKFHAEWDAIPRYKDKEIAAMQAEAALIDPMPGEIGDWPAAWASDTVKAGATVFSYVRFASRGPEGWDIAFEDRPAYLKAQSLVKKRQIALAGGRLAALLNAIWP